MRNFFEYHKGVVLLVAATLLLAVVIGIFGALAAMDRASLAESAAVTAAQPGQTAVTESGNFFTNLFSYFGNIKALREENQTLRNENVTLDKRLRDARGLEVENAQLRAMLELTKTQPQLELLAASVTAQNPSNWYDTFTIGKGSNHGIQEGQVVLTEDRALVGKIARVGDTWAEVVTLMDPQCGVGAMIARSGAVGVVEGDASLRLKGQCRLGYLARDAEAEIGDFVETSGMGGVYPKGLLVGKILELSEDHTNMSKSAVIEPLANLSKLRQVFVLLNAKEVAADAIDLSPLEQEEEEPVTQDDDEGDDEDEEAPRPTQTARPTSTPRPTQTARPTETPKPTQTINGQELRE